MVYYASSTRNWFAYSAELQGCPAHSKEALGFILGTVGHEHTVHKH